MTTPHAEYQRRLSVWRERVARFDRRDLYVANGRLTLALATAVLLWLALARESVSAGWPAVSACAFTALVVVHARVLRRGAHARHAARLYERGLDRLDGRWAGVGRDGTAFGEGHPYAHDLDLFGRASLFELLNTAHTEAGESTLAEWLKSPAAFDEVQARQSAVDELKSKVDYREALAILAPEGEVSRTGTLARWSTAPPVGVPRVLRPLFAAGALVAVVLAAAAYAEIVPWTLVVGWLLVEGAVAWAWRRSIESVVGRIGKPAADLALLSDLVERIEHEPVNAPRLVALQSGLRGGEVPASRAIARLTQLVSLYESCTHNLLFMPLTRALLVPEQFAIAIDNWHAAHGHAVSEWLRVVGEVEALGALATYAFEHPADPFPALAPDGPVFDAEALGHPLLPDAAAVRNDVGLGGPGTDLPRVLVISGSNMSGKSTLLRSVGVNAVLALAGAPVRAARLRLSALALGSTLRVEDSLEAGHSRFYAEILRIRGIVDTARGPAPLLFLLDEILHGTNSFDRRIGAEAIVRALVDAGAIGLVTTHDLALAELPERLGPIAVNVHFEDRLENGRMAFDYRMRPGVVTHSNALALMRAVGLDV